MKTVFFGALITVLFVSCTEDRSISTPPAIVNDPDSQLIYYWNFNMLMGQSSEVLPDYSDSESSASITYEGAGAGYMDGDIGGYTINARNNDPGGNLLKARNPSNTRSLILSLPTTGFEKPILQFALSRSNNGATTQNYTYSIDGVNYTDVLLEKISHNPMADPTVDLVVIDFSNISGTANNPNLKFKIDFVGDAAAGATGNNRFDNITLEGIPTQ